MTENRVTTGYRFRPLVAGLLAAALAGCSALPIPLDVAPGSDSALKREVALRYGPGTRAETLRRDLAASGYGESAGSGRFRFAARHAEPNLPCFSLATIQWNEDRRGRITEIQAAQLTCR